MPTTWTARSLWQKDLGDKLMRNQFGEGSTPVLYGNRLVIVWDHIGGQSFIVGARQDAPGGNSGGPTGTRSTPGPRRSWSSTTGGAQVVVPGMNRLRSYDLETGEVVWDSAGLTMNPIPSPVAADGMVFATSGFRGNNLKAIRLADARGDITGTDAIVWSLDRDTPYVPSPLLYDGVLYLLKTNSGILSAFDAKTGKPHYQLQRLERCRTSSPRRSARPGASTSPAARERRSSSAAARRSRCWPTMTLDDGFDASPALVDGELYLRGYRFLYSIGVK